MSDFYLTLPSHSSKNEFPSNTSNHFKIRLPNPIRLEGQGWKVGLMAITLPDPTSQLPPLLKGNEAMFYSSWYSISPNPNDPTSVYGELFEPSDLRLEDLETLTGVGFMRTVKSFYDKGRVTGILESGFKFKEDDGKKTYVDFKWEGEDFVIDTSKVNLKKSPGTTVATDYRPKFYIHKEFALEMGWFVEKGGNTVGLGPNLVIEIPDDVIPVPVDTDPINEYYWKVTRSESSSKDKKQASDYVQLTLTCNWRFINLNVAFKNVTGTTKRSLFIYSDVGGSGVVGNQVTDLLREVNYKREGKGSQYFEPLHIQYIDVRKETLDIVEVQVAETTGELVKFGAGNTIATLHFKKT